MLDPRLPKLPQSYLRINPAPNASAVAAPTFMVEAFTADQMRAYGLAVWKAAMQCAANMTKQMKPAGGRAWSEGQAAAFLALDDLEIAIRSLPDPSATPQDQGGER